MHGIPRQPSAMPSTDLVDLKRSACLEFLWSPSLAIILRKLFSWFQHRFSRKMLEGWSSNSAKRQRKFPSISNRRHSGEIFSVLALIQVVEAAQTLNTINTWHYTVGDCVTILTVYKTMHENASKTLING